MCRAPFALAVLAFITPALAQPDMFTNRPAFAPAEQPAQRFSRCEELRAMAEGVGETVYFKGGYRRLDPNHAVLDPCLATLEPE